MRIRPALILIVCCLTVLPLSASLADYTIWHSPLGMTTADSRLTLQTGSPTASLHITTSSAGDNQWAELGLTLPSDVSIDAVTLCYKLTNTASYISQIRLTQMTMPVGIPVLHDDGTDLVSPVADCYESYVGGVPVQGTFTLQLRLNFASSADAIDLGGIGIHVTTPISGFGGGIPSLPPATLSLRPNQPNPFGPSTTISYALAEGATVELSVFDVNGRVVRSLFQGRQTAGDHSISWDGRDDEGLAVASGTYYYRVAVGSEVASKGMVLLR